MAGACGLEEVRDMARVSRGGHVSDVSVLAGVRSVVDVSSVARERRMNAS